MYKFINGLEEACMNRKGEESLKTANAAKSLQESLKGLAKQYSEIPPSQSKESILEVYWQTQS